MILHLMRLCLHFIELTRTDYLKTSVKIGLFKIVFLDKLFLFFVLGVFYKILYLEID